MSPRSGLFVVLALFGALGSAHAAQRSFVASYGQDTNPCSIPAPCRSFGAAIAQTAVGGEVIVLDSAGYGPVTIGGSISLIAPSGVYAGVSVPGGDGITINAGGATVVLKGLSINGLGGGLGVNVIQVARLRIEGCVISRMNSNGILNTASGSQMIIVDTIIHNNGGTGVGIGANASVVLDHVRSEHNTFDGFYLVATTTEARAMIIDSVFAYNGVNGISVDSVAGAKTFVQVERSTMSSNGTNGLKAVSSLSGSQAVVMLSRNAINGNAGDGALFSGSSPGFAFGQLAENAMQANKGNGIYANGAAVIVSASANALSGSGSFDFKCDDAANSFFSHGNNDAATFSSVGGCLKTIGLF